MFGGVSRIDSIVKESASVFRALRYDQGHGLSDSMVNDKP